MELRGVWTTTPTGLSLEVPDLLMMQAWAEFHELRMDVELDCCIEADEYEEMVVMFSRKSGFRRWMIWRSANGIVVQPMVGRQMLFDTMADALEKLIPARN